MISKEVLGWLEMLAGAAISLYAANRGRRGVFTHLRNRGEALIGAMLIAIGIQTHLDRLNVEMPFFRWLPLGLGILGVALIVAAKLSPSEDTEPEQRALSSTRRSPDLADVVDGGEIARKPAPVDRIRR